MAMAEDGHSDRKCRMEFSGYQESKRTCFGDERDLSMADADDTIFRYLCPRGKVGSVIGVSGQVMRQLRADTGAKIWVNKGLPECDDRVVTIISTSRKTNQLEDSDIYVCPAEDALLRVHDLLTTEGPVGDKENYGGYGTSIARLLVPSDIMGCVIGKRGATIHGIRNDTGARILMFKYDQQPACAITGDQFIKITGSAFGVRSALLQIAACLCGKSLRFQHLIPFEVSQRRPLIGQYGAEENDAPPTFRASNYRRDYKDDAEGRPSFLPPIRDVDSPKEFTIRLLCPSVNIGDVIGKGGATIQQIREESRALIRVDSDAEEDDCILIVSSKESFDDPSPTIDAIVRLQPKCSAKTESESTGPTYVTRLLISRVGCLIGKGGCTIKELRRSTRANILIVERGDVPRVAAEDEEMVQITAEPDVARNALIQVANCLRANLFGREYAISSAWNPVNHHSLSRNAFDQSYHSGQGSTSSWGCHSSPGEIDASSEARHSETHGTYGGSPQKKLTTMEPGANSCQA